MSCRFCYAFGRESVGTRSFKNEPIAVSKYWKKGKGGFRTDNFTSHLKLQHTKRWKELQKFPLKDKRRFFDVQVPFTETLRAHFGSIDNDLILIVIESIVVEVLQEMLMEDSEFRLSSTIRHKVESMMYEVKINNKQNFEIVIGQVMISGSFRSTQRSISRLKSQGTLSYVGSITENDITKYFQCLTALSLQ